MQCQADVEVIFEYGRKFVLEKVTPQVDLRYRTLILEFRRGAIAAKCLYWGSVGCFSMQQDVD